MNDTRKVIGWQSEPFLNGYMPRGFECEYSSVGGGHLHYPWGRDAFDRAGSMRRHFVHEADYQPVEPGRKGPRGEDLDGLWACTGCGHLVQPVYEPEPKACPHCGGEL